MGPGRGREGERKWEGRGGKEGRRWEEKRGEGREERGNGSMHPLGFSKVGAYDLPYHFFDTYFPIM